MTSLAEPARSRVIYLIGLRGTGKSTVGRLLAERLALPFVDADAELEAREARSIREIFAADGEPRFRDIESELLIELSRRGPAVIATGGGVILRDENRQRMRATGKVVWLTAEVDTLAARLAGDATTADRRPPLTVGGRAEIEELLRERRPLYADCADLTVRTDGRSPESVAADILAACSTSSWMTP